MTDQHPAADSPSEMLNAFLTSVREFARSVDALPDDLWLRKVVNWTPRDIVAHLIGWNVYVREGCDLLRTGKAPPFLDDRAHDYRHVNAASVKRYANRDRRALLKELEASFRELERYLAGLDDATWNAGVLYDNRPVTIRKVFEDSPAATITTGSVSSTGR